MHEARLRMSRDNTRKRRLTRARRPPKDNRRQRVGVNERGERFSLAHEMLLPRDFVERARPHPLGERLVLLMLRWK